MRSLERRIADGRVLKTIKRWLTAPVVENASPVGGIADAEARRKKRGTPQGGVISPLLANLLLPTFPAGVATSRPSGTTRCLRRELR